VVVEGADAVLTIPSRAAQSAAGGRPHAQNAAGGRSHSSIGDLGLPSALWLVSLLIAAVYLVVFIVKLPQIVELATWNSDVASVFAMTETLVHTGTGGHTLMASTGAYVPMWFGLLTAWLPLHRTLWEVAASAVFLAAALTVGWSVSQLATRRAAILAVLLALVVSTPAFTIFTAAATHNTVYLATPLLGAYLVWMAQTNVEKRARVCVVSVVAGLALGACFASDLLLLITGIVPFAFTAAVVGLQRTQRSTVFSISAFTTLVVALPTAWVTSEIMGSFGFVVERPSTEIVFSALPLHSEYLFEGLKELFGGYLGGHQTPGVWRAAQGIASDVTMAVALSMLLVFGVLTLVRFIRLSWRRRDEHATPRDLATVAHIVYWAGSAASAVVAFVLSANADAPRPQYYATLIFSVAAVAPLLMRPSSPGRWLVPLGASVFFAASLVGLTGTDFSTGLFARDQQAIVRLAEANHATTGYAGYWYASDLTWNSHERVRVRPAGLCENPTGADFCPFYINRIPSWYSTTPQRTFLLVNPKEEYLYLIPPGLGPPVATYAFPDSTKMYVYPYNIASRLGPARN
jgi:hypothetical protein